MKWLRDGARTIRLCMLGSFRASASLVGSCQRVQSRSYSEQPSQTRYQISENSKLVKQMNKLIQNMPPQLKVDQPKVQAILINNLNLTNMTWLPKPNILTIKWSTTTKNNQLPDKLSSRWTENSAKNTMNDGIKGLKVYKCVLEWISKLNKKTSFLLIWVWYPAAIKLYEPLAIEQPLYKFNR